MSSSALCPIDALHTSLNTLESLIANCLASPDVRAVHKLRTQTRRVEATLTLLPLLPNLPKRSKRRAAVSRLLRRTRRAAGEVRDLDVHREMLARYAAEEHAFAEGETAPRSEKGTPASRKGHLRKLDRASALPAPAVSADRGLSQAAAELQDHLKEQRDHTAAHLRHTLQDLQEALTKAAEDLFAELAPLQDVTLSAAELLRHADRVSRRSKLLQTGAVRKLKEDELHLLRKDAKAGRYVAESLPEEPTLTQAAERLEALQHMGGEWHDALEIARAAKKYFGKAHPLTNAYRALRGVKLATYRDALTALQAASRKPAKQRTARAAKAGSEPAAKGPRTPRRAAPRKRAAA